MFISGLLVLVLFVVAVIAVLVVVGSMAARSYGDANGDARYCGKCGYSTTGLPSDRCPECGSDFSVVGFLDRPVAGQWVPLMVLLAWVALSPVAFCVISGAIMSIAPQNVTRSESQTWQEPASGAYASFRIQHDTRSRIGWAARSTAVIESAWEIRFGNGRPALVLKGEGLRGPIVARRGRSSEAHDRELSGAFIADRLTEAFPDANREQFVREAEDVYCMIASRVDLTTPEPAMTAFGGNVGSGSASTQMPAPFVPIVLLTMFSIFWMLGIILIIRWNRRRQAAHGT